MLRLCAIGRKQPASSKRPIIDLPINRPEWDRQNIWEFFGQFRLELSEEFEGSSSQKLTDRQRDKKLVLFPTEVKAMWPAMPTDLSRPRRVNFLTACEKNFITKICVIEIKAAAEPGT